MIFPPIGQSGSLTSQHKRLLSLSSGVASVANPSASQAALGADNGPGFGWRSIGVIKLGYQFQWSERATIRLGYNKGDNPIRPADVTFNILAPGVMTSHYTFGGTYTLSDKSDWTWALMYAPEVTVSGSSLFGPLSGAGNDFADETIRMKQYSFGVNYSKRF